MGNTSSRSRNTTYPGSQDQVQVLHELLERRSDENHKRGSALAKDDEVKKRTITSDAFLNLPENPTNPPDDPKETKERGTQTAPPQQVQPEPEPPLPPSENPQHKPQDTSATSHFKVFWSRFAETDRERILSETPDSSLHLLKKLPDALNILLNIGELSSGDDLDRVKATLLKANLSVRGITPENLEHLWKVSANAFDEKQVDEARLAHQKKVSMTMSLLLNTGVITTDERFFDSVKPKVKSFLGEQVDHIQADKLFGLWAELIDDF